MVLAVVNVALLSGVARMEASFLGVMIFVQAAVRDRQGDLGTVADVAARPGGSAEVADAGYTRDDLG
jgi:hypothetical protein